MTTVAYKDGVMASDSQLTDGSDYYLSTCEKIIKLESGGVLGWAGEDDGRLIRALLDEVYFGDEIPSSKKLSELEMEFVGLLVLPDGSLWYIAVDEILGKYKAQVIKMERNFAAIGSGERFALGAMLAGCSARKAVAYSCELDIYSSTPIKWVKCPN